MQAIIYTRVSSDEQVKGTSLEFQEELCRKYCEERGFEVLEVFREEGESAKTADRKELLRALEYSRKHKGQIHAFVVAKVDRFARNTEDHFYVRKTLLEYGLTLHSVTEPIGNNPSGKFVETVLAASAEFDNAIRKQRSTDGMIAKIGQGIWPWKPPIGYTCQHVKRQRQKKTEPDPPDPVLFPILQRGLKEYAKGVIHSQAELARLLDNWGLEKARKRQTTPQFVERLLGKYLKFYAGILANPWTGENQKGLHAPMIAEEEYHRIRLIRSGKAKVISRDRENPIFPLRRTVRCGFCLRHYTGGLSRGNGGKYPYYHCPNKQCEAFGKTIRKDHLEGGFTDELDRLAPNERALLVFKETVLDVWRERRRSSASAAETRARQLSELADRRRRIFEMREDGSYSTAMFQERLADVDRQIVQLKMAGEALSQSLDVETALSRAVASVENPSRTWLELKPRLRPRFQKLVFPAGIPYDRNRGFGTAELGLLFTLGRQSGGQKSHLVPLVRDGWNQLVEYLREFQALEEESGLAAA